MRVLEPSRVSPAPTQDLLCICVCSAVIRVCVYPAVFVHWASDLEPKPRIILFICLCLGLGRPGLEIEILGLDLADMDLDLWGLGLDVARLACRPYPRKRK